jgi:hypothetical protein
LELLLAPADAFLGSLSKLLLAAKSRLGSVMVAGAQVRLRKQIMEIAVPVGGGGGFQVGDGLGGSISL